MDTPHLKLENPSRTNAVTCRCEAGARTLKGGRLGDSACSQQSECAASFQRGKDDWNDLNVCVGKTASLVLFASCHVHLKTRGPKDIK